MSLGTEPPVGPLRRRSMSRTRRTLTLTAGALLGATALGACGSTSYPSGAGSGSATSTTSSAPTSPSVSATATPSGCTPTTPQDAAPSARVDVDGDGTREAVVLSAGCDGVRASSGSRTWSATPSPQEPLAGEAYGVRVPGRRAELVVTRARHPRGGFQLRVYAAQGSRLVELRRGTEPLLPFVATDVQEHPWSVTCAQGALVVTEAVAHEPAGVIAAWDVRRTAYTLGEAADLTAGPTREVADNVLPATLRQDWGDLVRHTAFAGCRVG